MKLSVVIGAARQHRVPAMVTERTVRWHSGGLENLQVIHTWDKDFACDPGPTGFTLFRFAAPELAGREGRVLYLDSDMLVLSSLSELFSMDMKGMNVLAPENQSAVMLMDAGTCPFSLESAKSTYAKAKGILQFRPPLGGAKVSRTLPSEWNDLDRVTDRTKLLHFTNMRTQPWIPDRKGRHAHADLWFKWLRSSVKIDHIPYQWVKEDVAAGFLHSECLVDL